MNTDITVTTRFDYQEGEILHTSRPDYRWWMRLWCFITFRGSPEIQEKFTVVDATETTITVRPEE